MRVAVTGAAGFVGSMIARVLVQAGNSVLAIDDMSKGKTENLEGVECDLHEGDAGECLAIEKCDAIVHAAAYPDIKSNWAKPSERERQWQINAELTRDVLECAAPGALFVMISTCAVYGSGVGITEETLPNPTSPYAASKIAAEAWVTAFAAADRIRATTLRLVNVVGPRYAHGHIADFVSQVRRGGSIHALDDGSKKKSFVHVEDVAETVGAVLRMMARVKPRTAVFNVTSPYRWSWRDTVEVMRAMSPHDVPFTLTHEERRSGWTGDADEMVVESSHLQDAHWRRRSIVEGVRQSLESLGWSK